MIERKVNLSGLVLAAGTSSRAGSKNKLLVEVDGVPMVRRVVEAILGAGVRDVLVVLGHESDRVKAALNGLNTQFEVNDGYEDGMGSSIAAGARCLVDKSLDGVLVCLSDLPFLNSLEISLVVDEFARLGFEKIVAPTYRGRRGHPVVFPQCVLRNLARLSGDRGARDLIRSTGAVDIEMRTAGCIKDMDRID